MEKIVYLLGAGFSAPLGLPVMDNFLVKSRDCYFGAPEKHEHFKDVFETIARLSVTKNFFETDLFNVEEILSILDMQAQLEGTRLRESFVRYIADTIAHFTPSIPGYVGSLPGNWEGFIFGREHLWRAYGAFVASIHSIGFTELGPYPDIRHQCVPLIPQTRRYDVISLNYDLVLENLAMFIDTRYNGMGELRFQTPGIASSGTASNRPWLCKLHGTVGADIVPPTWSKAVHPFIFEQWKQAHQLLAEANHIRVIGYSLPVADSYIKYLFKSSVLKSEHLKTIDVILLDPDGHAQRRYTDFLTFKYRRFANARSEQYLTDIQFSTLEGGSSRPERVDFDRLEHVHNAFMQKHSGQEEEEE